MAKMSPINVLSDPPEIHFVSPSRDMAFKSSNWDCSQLEITIQTYSGYYNQVMTAIAGTGDVNLAG